MARILSQGLVCSWAFVEEEIITSVQLEIGHVTVQSKGIYSSEKWWQEY